MSNIIRTILVYWSRLRFLICLGNGKLYNLNGSITYHKWFKLHRINGPACIYSGGYHSWYQNGLLHRTDGPAIIWPDKDSFWYQNDKLHRIDGPAIEWTSGGKEWYLNDNQYTFREWQIEKNKLTLLNNLNTLTS